MTNANPTQSLLEWTSTKLQPWKQDALRRLASKDALVEDDLEELYRILKKEVGIPTDAIPPEPIPIDETHLGAAASGLPISLRAIKNVNGVNRLAPGGNLEFDPTGLTVVFGANGSGKTGFIRILRHACRTRLNDPRKLEILANVYGDNVGPKEATIVVNNNGAEREIAWTEDAPGSEYLQQATVFDHEAAGLYVDEGNEIAFLPFGLDLPYKLNEVCIDLQGRIEAEIQANTVQLALNAVAFPDGSSSASKGFYDNLTGQTSDETINAASSYSEENEARLNELNRLLKGSVAEVADLRALGQWAKTVSSETMSVSQLLSDDSVNQLITLRGKAGAAREAAELSAKGDFSEEPLAGVGAETWRALWQAAREFSVNEAYQRREFPVIDEGDDGQAPLCVLCHQSLSPVAKDRFERFERYVSGTLASEASELEAEFATAFDEFRTSAEEVGSIDMKVLAQLRARNEPLATTLLAWDEKAGAYRTRILEGLDSGEAITIEMIGTPPSRELTLISESLAVEVEKRDAAFTAEQRQELEQEKCDLEDRKLLSGNVGTLTSRRDILALQDLLNKALGLAQTRGITQKANEFVDTFVTDLVVGQFNTERENLGIGHLNISLKRKSGRTGAVFETDSGTKLTNTVSKVLSEGEQRALALSAFLAETGISMPNGPIIIDDPVSSLDRERGQRVAARLAEEASNRQVVVFTHDLVFLNDICAAAADRQLDPLTQAIFSNANGSGIVDPVGEPWEGKAVERRISLLKDGLPELTELHNESPSDYSIKARNWYSRLRDAYERAVEERIFHGVVQRFSNEVRTMELRYIALPDDLAIRFHEGMSKSNTYSHDNPQTLSKLVPEPGELETDLNTFENLLTDLKSAQKQAEKGRSAMRPARR